MSKPETIKIDNVEYIRKDSVKPIKGWSSAKKEHAFEVGKRYLFQTVTLYWLGTIVGITEGEIVITDAAWVADMGKASSFFGGNDPNESESLPAGKEMILSRGALVAVIEAQHKAITK